MVLLLLIIFFFVSERANLSTIVAQELINLGVRIVNFTCDGPNVHISMLKKLGVNFDPDKLDTQIFKDLDSPPIHMILDPSHDIKNVRNAWKHHRILVNSKGQEINWNYLVKLVHLQEHEHLNCANKLRNLHINFEPQKMSVKLATQLFSRSVAKALEFCRETLKLTDFQGSEGTQEFIQTMNDLFDFMNSRTKYGKGMKSAMSEENYEVWKPFLDMTEEYILGLKSQAGKNMVSEDSRKTGFIGFIANIHSVQKIFSLIVAGGHLQYLCIYKLSQDHLEHFFGLIRARFGANTNPTAFQFKNTYRQILAGITGSIVYGSNVLLQDNTEMIALIPSAQAKMDYICENYDLEDFDIEMISNSSQSDYLKYVIDYISGFVVKKISAKLSCDECKRQNIDHVISYSHFLTLLSFLLVAVLFLLCCCSCCVVFLLLLLLFVVVISLYTT